MVATAGVGGERRGRNEPTEGGQHAPSQTTQDAAAGGAGRERAGQVVEALVIHRGHTLPEPGRNPESRHENLSAQTQREAR